MNSPARTYTAEIVSIGTELLLGQIVDTHAPRMSKILAETGIGCLRRSTLGDNLGRLTQGLKEALDRADIVVAIGGLGPTQDDLTRDAIAAALGDKLVHIPEVEAQLREFFASREIPYVESNSRQATRPESATLIENPNGTAPGLLCKKGGKIVIALPGPRGEFNPMAEGPVQSFLAELSGQVIHSRTLRVVGLGESTVEARIHHLMQGESPSVAPYAHLGEVHLRVTAAASTIAEANRLIDPMEAQIRDILGANVFGVDGENLEATVLNLLRERGWKLAVAESMTGGALAARLTSVPGASNVFVGGVVAYSVAAKVELLGIDPSLVKRYGPVSAECATAMATGLQKRLNTQVALSITGNAGPGVDLDRKPVGMVYMGIASPLGDTVEGTEFRGIRDDIQRKATQSILVSLRNQLTKPGES